MSHWNGDSESVSLAKRFPLTEKLRALIRADAQNPFNFVRWGNPNTSITSSNFGKVDPTEQNNARLVQMALKLSF